MINLLGWLETRLARNTSNYINIALVFILFKVVKLFHHNSRYFEPA